MQGTLTIRGPIVLDSPQFHYVNTTATSTSAAQSYHLCVCENGKLFRVPGNPLGCAGASDSINPCQN